MPYIMLLMVLFGGHASAHQFTPTYPELESSYVSGVLKTTMDLFNSRKDVSYYEIGVFDGEWNRVPFATESRIVKIDYLRRKKIDIFIRESDRAKAVYICSKSKLLARGSAVTSISSRICSKIK